MKSEISIKQLLYIASFLGAIAGGLKGFFYIKDTIRQEVEKVAKEVAQEEIHHSVQVLTWEEFSERTFVPEEDIPKKVAEMYIDLNAALDSIEGFRRVYLPMLQDEKQTIDVGLKVKLAWGGKTKYLHTDNKWYDAYYIEEADWYKFINDKNEWELCK